MGSNKLN